VIAIKHLLEAEAEQLLHDNGLAYRKCLREFKKCCSIEKFKIILGRHSWLRSYLLRDEASHLLRAVVNDKRINKNSKKRLVETFPILIAGVKDLKQFARWSTDK